MKVAVHQTLVSYHAPMTPKNAVYLGNSLKYDDQEVLESLTLFRESVISYSLLQKHFKMIIYWDFIWLIFMFNFG